MGNGRPVIRDRTGQVALTVSGKGPVRVRVDLGQRGFGAAEIECALQKASADWYELAHSTRIRKFGSAQPADFKAKAKQMRFLQFRGFESDHIRAAFGKD
ncbi:MAG: regulatory protein RecX [Proteobacteria bacterium]|nr:regulatory protein RecX [Pseudomonadota bacterium]